MKKNKKNLSAKFYPIAKVSIPQLLEMHKVFVQYYDNADLQTFVKDMGKKTGIFLLEDKSLKRIVGFSTYSEIEMLKDGERMLGLFSGDTVLEKEYWGNKALNNAFAFKLFRTKLKNPTTPIFWLLISKGYKTYLLLTNNFHKHYPSYSETHPVLESVVDTYCNELYPDAYIPEKRLLDFGDAYMYLKEDVADITPEMKRNNPNIQHFEDLNPSWRKGTELPCAAEVSFTAAWEFLKNKKLGLSKKKKMAQLSLGVS